MSLETGTSTIQEQLAKMKEELELAKSMGLTNRAEEIAAEMINLQAPTVRAGLEKEQKCQQALETLFGLIKTLDLNNVRRFKPQQVEELTLEDFASFLRKKFSFSFGNENDFVDNESGLGFPAGEYITFGNTGVVVRFPKKSIAGMDFFEVWKVHDPQIVARVRERFRL